MTEVAGLVLIDGDARDPALAKITDLWQPMLMGMQRQRAVKHLSSYKRTLKPAALVVRNQ
jgi:hypothetical protein